MEIGWLIVGLIIIRWLAHLAYHWRQRQPW